LEAARSTVRRPASEAVDAKRFQMEGHSLASQCKHRRAGLDRPRALPEVFWQRCPTLL